MTDEELLEIYIEKHGMKGNITLPVSSVIDLLRYNNDNKRQLKEAKRLLKLAADDIETAMTEEKCKLCGLDYCGNDTICKWRYADEVEKFLKL